MTITALPALDRTASTFRSDTDTFFATQLPAFSVQAEAARIQINTNTQTATDKAATATTQAALATTNGAAQVTLATEQAELATTNGAAQLALAVAQVALTAADRVQTGLDRIQTGADRTATGISAAAAEASRIAASKLNLGNKTTAPTLDNQGAALLAGATYYDTTLTLWRVWTGTAWAIGVSSVAGVSSINGQTGDVLLASTSLSGTKTIYVSQTIVYTVTNFNVFSTYAVQVSAGSVSMAGDTITFIAPASAQVVTFTVTTDGVPTAYPLTILGAGVVTPTITSPANAATGVFDSLTITSSAFNWLGVSDTHATSDWQLSTNAGFTAIVQSSTASASNKTSWSVTGLSVSTTYYVRVRHTGAANGTSAYSPATSFATAAEFTSYIATPTATPASFGSSFEGGFYTGMIWNEVVQSASSTAVATGSKTFTVPSMSASPLVYAGQSLEVRSRANPANKMLGTVSFAGGTAITLNITSVTGSGTFTDWSIMARYRVIVAPKSSGENAAISYKNANTAAPVACQTLSEGRRATLAMAAADTSTVYPAAHWCNSLSIAGKADWYLPARDELELCWRNLKPATDANYTSGPRAKSSINYANLGATDDGSTDGFGVNNNSNPTATAYTSGTPSQTAATAFHTGGAEAFTYGSSYYWSASEYSETLAWSQYWHSSEPGFQNRTSKTNARVVRAVRRSII